MRNLLICSKEVNAQNQVHTTVQRLGKAWFQYKIKLYILEYIFQHGYRNAWIQDSDRPTDADMNQAPT